uniref:Uncharacterized protein n=1 Tax=Candidatus Kentrum sp. UNK TaxID=2126344 RepID=A0A451AQH4_9GAMM|nr:MAG: hypothetical protein BECKUNK1418G_GA0071005_100253 [Candidatus Kentron sp. UNK]VFK68324.1 MAG: hypothetical protein BECKUNK1418H_GA0071006_100153 [Candidatus Kentron sp. UNK]
MDLSLITTFGPSIFIFAAAAWITMSRRTIVNQGSIDALSAKIENMQKSFDTRIETAKAEMELKIAEYKESRAQHCSQVQGRIHRLESGADSSPNHGDIQKMYETIHAMDNRLSGEMQEMKQTMGAISGALSGVDSTLSTIQTNLIGKGLLSIGPIPRSAE